MRHNHRFQRDVLAFGEATPEPGRWGSMKSVAFIIFVVIAFSESARAASLADAEHVVVTDVGAGEGAKLCKGFSLTAAEATIFLNRSAVVTHREVHDHYNVAPCWVRGTASFHGYPAQWEIRAGGTGSITLYSGEHLSVVDEAQRNESE